MATASPTSTLHDEQQLISSLVALMKQEQQSLVNADTDGLSALSTQKNLLVQQLAQLARQRHQALGAAGFEAAEAGMDACLAGSADGAARSQWEQLLLHTRDAKELNRVNGLLINKHLSHNQTILQAMRTPTGAPDVGTVYTQSGQASALSPSRRYVIG